MVAMLADPVCVSLCIRWGCVLTQSIQLQRKEHSADAKCLQLPRGCVLPLARWQTVLTGTSAVRLVPSRYCSAAPTFVAMHVMHFCIGCFRDHATHDCSYGQCP